MFVASIGDLDSDMYMVQLWDEPNFIYIRFFTSPTLGIIEYFKNQFKVENWP